MRWFRGPEALPPTGPAEMLALAQDLRRRADISAGDASRPMATRGDLREWAAEIESFARGVVEVRCFPAPQPDAEGGRQ